MPYPESDAEKIYEELTKIRHLLEIIARYNLKRELELIATTKERKRMWSLFDGFSSTEEIAQKANVTQRAVQIFVKELLNRDLVTMEKRGYPKRKFDYIPSDWKVE